MPRTFLFDGEHRPRALPAWWPNSSASSQLAETRDCAPSALLPNNSPSSQVVYGVLMPRLGKSGSNTHSSVIISALMEQQEQGQNSCDYITKECTEAISKLETLVRLSAVPIFVFSGPIRPYSGRDNTHENSSAPGGSEIRAAGLVPSQRLSGCENSRDPQHRTTGT